MRFSIKFSAIT